MGGGPRRHIEGGGGRSKKVTNSEIRGECKLADGEQFRFLFHPGNIKDMEKPKNGLGATLCMRFHTMGYCFRDCKYVKGHGVLSSGETAELATFMASARQERKKFLAGRGAEGKNKPGEKNRENPAVTFANTSVTMP